MKSMIGTGKKSPLIEAVPTNANKENKRTVVIVGVERGGTSMVAGVVRAMGINLGERSGRNHEDPKFLTDDRNKLLAQIKLNNQKYDTWGFKLPKASLMLEFFNQTLRNPYYIVVFRNIAATVESWQKRGPNDPFETGKHAIQYYLKALENIQFSNRPTLFVNYESACENVNGFIDQLSAFLGIKLDSGGHQRACSMITGNGGGYVDLPEYYFHIDELDTSTKLSTPFNIIHPDNSAPLSTMSPKKVSDRIIIVPQEGGFFPSTIFIRFDLDVGDKKILFEDGIRIYMDFTDTFFPGHAFRPKLRKGQNLIKIESNGKAKRIAIGGLSPDIVFSVGQLKVFLNAEDEAKELENNFSKFEFKLLKYRVLFNRIISKFKRLIKGLSA